MIGFGRTLRNLGSRASRPAMAKAHSVALGTNTPRRIVKHPGRGSSAGLNAQSTARLEMSGTGYSNPNIGSGKHRNKVYPRPGRINRNQEPYFGRPRPSKTFDTRKPKTSIDK